MKRVEISSELRVFLVWAGISVALLGLDRLGLFGGVRNLTEGALIPVEQGVFRFSTLLRSPFEMLRFWRTGTARIADLERQVAELTVDAAKLAALKEENAAMRRLLDAPLPAQWSFLPAPIVGRGEEMSIGIGVRDGVEVGDEVISEEVLIGTVSQASQRQSSVRLLKDPASKVPVYLPASGADGLLEGRFGSQMVLTQVLQSAEIKQDEMVVSSGAFGAARGLVVGKVAKIISEENDVYKEALVEPLFDINWLQTVFVVKKK